MGSGFPIPLLLLLLSALHPIIGSGHDPVLVLEGPERDGIRLRCLSERSSPEVRLLWSDGRGRNLTGIPEPEGNSGKAGSSLLLRPGAGNAAACRVLDPRRRAASQSAVVIADVFFPATSPWLPALVLLLLLALSLVLAAALRLRRNRRVLAQERKAQQEIQEEIEELRMELEEEMGKFQKEEHEMAAKIGQLQAQLDFRRAQSHAVSLTLDQRRLSPALQLQGRSRLLLPLPPADPASPAPRTALAVALQGFSSGKHYWEVEVEPGQDSAWQLGVLGEDTRDSLPGEGDPIPEEKAPGLACSRGEFRLPGGELSGDCGRCRVLGVLLDQESRLLSFFDAEEKRRLGSVPLELPRSLYPFFGLGSAGSGLGIRPVGV